MTKPKEKETLVVANQPTAKPSRKMEGAAAGVAPGYLLGTVIVWLLKSPDTMGLNIPSDVETAIVTLCTVAVAGVIGYYRKEQAVVVAEE